MGGDVEPLELSPTPSHTKLVGDIKNPHHCSKRVGNVFPGVMVTAHSHALGGWGEIIYGLILAAIGAFTH